MKEDNIWVFLSHSKEDYEKVRVVRDLLEEYQFRPLMFFLKCLNDKDEIDTLIKREIDSRKRFILCDSPNARLSEWVQKEVDYIKSKQRYYYTIDITAPSDEISKKILQFIGESTVYISHSRNDELYYEYLKTMLHNDLEIRVFDLREILSAGDSFEKKNKEMIDNSLLNGYIIFLITKNFMNSSYCLRELEYVLQRYNSKNVIFLRNTNIEKPRITNYNKFKEYMVDYKDGAILINKGRFYWEFMNGRIKDGVKNEDRASLYWMAYHYYWDDDRFDNSNTAGMRMYTLNLLKRSMEKGFVLAEDLYNKILYDYPELKNDAIESDVFIIHNGKDLSKFVAKKIDNQVTKLGYSVWYYDDVKIVKDIAIQLFRGMEQAKNIILIIHDDFFEICKQECRKDNWFCRLIAHALKIKRNIIPIIIGKYKMPKQEFLPEELKELTRKNTLEYSSAYFEEYLNKLIEER